MKHYQDIVVPEHTHRQLDHITCDLCGEVINTHPAPYENRTATIEMEHTTNYPEGGFSSSICIDMCFDCFNGKLLPWLEETFRFTPTIKEEDW